jgi:hypothetical protein
MNLDPASSSVLPRKVVPPSTRFGRTTHSTLRKTTVWVVLKAQTRDFVTNPYPGRVFSLLVVFEAFSVTWHPPRLFPEAGVPSEDSQA